MRLIAAFYFIFLLSIAVNAFDTGAWFDGAGATFKDAEARVSKIAKDVGDEASKAAQSVGAFVDEHVQAIGREAGFSGMAAIKREITKTISTANDFKRYLDEHDIGIEEFTQRLSDALAPLYAEISKADTDTSTGDDKLQLAIQHAGQAILSVSEKYDLPEDETRDSWEKLSHELLQLLNTIGQFVKDHPTLVANILFFIGSMFLGGAVPVLLRPILSIFGFGVHGPIRGTAAAWAQRYFWGGAVNAGTWFARLQRAGMTAQAGQGLGALYTGLASVIGGMGVWFSSNGTAAATGK